MPLRIFLLFFAGLTAVVLSSTQAFGQIVSLPTEFPAWVHLDVAPAESALFADAADGRLDSLDLLSAAFAADIVRDPATQNRYRKQFDGWIDELQPLLAGQFEPAARTKIVFEFLQRRVLRGSYHETANSLAALFDQGQYNCVSSTLIFCCLAERLQLNIRAAEAPGHVIARLVDGLQLFDIETTRRDWLGGIKPLAGKPDRGYRQLSMPGLLALSYYNRGVDALENGDFDAALAENIKALRLDPASAAARSNLLAALNNGASATSDKGFHASALERLRFSRLIAPDFGPATKNLQVVRRRQVIELCDRRDFRAALTLLVEALHENPQERRIAGRPSGGAQLRRTPLAGFGACGGCGRLVSAGLGRATGRRVAQPNFRVAVMHWADEAFRRHDYAEAIGRTEYASRPGELDAARLNNLRYGYRQWARHLHATGRDAEASAWHIRPPRTRSWPGRLKLRQFDSSPGVT